MFQCRLPEEQAQALALISNRILNSNQSNSDNELILGDQPADAASDRGRRLVRSKDIERLYENAYETGDKRLLQRLDLFQRISDGLLAHEDQSINGQLNELLLSAFNGIADHNDRNREFRLGGRAEQSGKARRLRRFAFSKGENRSARVI